MASAVDIANLALSHLGDLRILSFDDATKAGRALKDVFPKVRDTVLRTHPWNCAVKRLKLAASATAPPFGYARAFPLPSDCLRVLDVGNTQSPAYPSRLPWVVEGGDVLSGEAAPLAVRYIRREEDTEKYDSLLVEAMAARLAHQLCEELTQSNTKRAALWDEWLAKLAEARGVDGQEQSDMPIEADTWEQVRYGG